MGFYKVVARTGHRGVGRSGEIAIYLVAGGIIDASNQAKGFPGVKRNMASAILSVKMVSELQFVRGLITTAYTDYDYHTKNESFQSLSDIETNIVGVDFTTIEGKMLRNFCNRYAATDDIKLKKEIDKEFMAWANNQLEQEDNDNCNFGR